MGTIKKLCACFVVSLVFCMFFAVPSYADEVSGAMPEDASSLENVSMSNEEDSLAQITENGSESDVVENPSENEAGENQTADETAKGQSEDEAVENDESSLGGDTDSELSLIVDDTGTITGSGDTIVKVLEPEDGSVDVVEHLLVNGTNATDVLKKQIELSGGTTTTRNDIPSVTHVSYYDASTDTLLEDYYVRSDSGAVVDINRGSLSSSKQAKIVETVENVRTETEVYNSVNAIQKAVNNSLSCVTVASESVVLRINAGTYEGDIIIDKTAFSSTVLWSTFTLYLLVSDSYTAPTGSNVIDKDTIGSMGAGIAKVNGRIIINGVNVVIAGLLFGEDDTIAVGSADMTLYGTSVADAISATIAGSNNVTIITGEGDDVVTVKKGTVSKNEASEEASATEEEESEANADEDPDADVAALSIYGGEGSDTVSLDVAVAYSEVYIYGGNGVDALHFIGSLKADAAESGIALGTDKGDVFTFATGLISKIKVQAQGVETYTDALENKKKVELTSANIKDGVITLNASADDLTDYVLNAYRTEDSNYVFLNKDGDIIILKDVMTISNGLPVLSSLKVILDAPLTMGSAIVLGNIDAAHLNLFLIGGSQMTLANGKTIAAGNVSIELSAKDYLALSDSKDKLKISAFTANSYFVAEQDTSIASAGNVVITVTSTQAGNLVPMEGFNPLVVKSGSAYVILRGKIEAGGTVEIRTNHTINVNAKNSSLAELYVPVAINTAFSESYITLEPTGSITAGGSARLRAYSQISIEAKAVTGSLPVSFTVSWILDKTYVQIDGNITAAAGSVILEALADSKLIAVSSSKQYGRTIITVDSKGKPINTNESSTQNKFTLFGSLAFADQTVYVHVSKNASLTAAQDIIMNAVSKLDATSMGRKGDAASMKSVSAKTGTISYLLELAYSAVDVVKVYLPDLASKWTEKLQKIEKGLRNSANSYSLTADSSTGGQVSLVRTAQEGATVQVTVTPEEGYTVDSMTITYFDPATRKWMEVPVRAYNVSDGVYYCFTMPKANVHLTAFFRGKTASDPEIRNYTADPQDINIGDIINSAVQSDFKPTKYGADHQIVAFSVQKTNNAGAIGANTKTANAGETIRLLVVPDKGFLLKADSLCVYYTNNEGKQMSVTVSADLSGNYYFTVPEDIKAGTKLELWGKFEAELTAEEVRKVTDNGAGAFAVSVITNDCSAFVDTTGTITAGETLKINSNAVTTNVTYADASAVKQNIVKGQTTATSNNGIQYDKRMMDAVTIGEQKNLETYVEGRTLIAPLYTTISATCGGRVDILKNAKDKNILAFKVTLGSEGYELERMQLKGTGKDGRIFAYDLVYTISKGGYTLSDADLDAIDFSLWDQYVTVTTIFRGKDIEISTDNAPSGISVVGNARVGDTIYVNAENVDKSVTYTVKIKKRITGSFIQDVHVQADGSFTFIVPHVATAGVWETLLVSFEVTNKANEVEVSGTDEERSLVSVQHHASKGETIVISPTDKLTKSGEKVKLYAKIGDGAETEITDWKIVLPEDLADDAKIAIRVEKDGNKANYFDIQYVTGYGVIELPNRVSPGQKFTFTIKPEKDYKLSSGGLVLVYKTSDGKTKEVTVKSDRYGKYAYTLPDIAEKGAVTVKVYFEESESVYRQDDVQTVGAGVAVAVSVFNHSNEASVRKGTLDVDGLEITAISGTGKRPMQNFTAAEAGYSQGKTGISGAVAVTVNKVNTDASVADSTPVTIGGGNLNLIANTYLDMATKALAAEPTCGRDITQGPGTNVGVGSGIAVSVTSVDTNAVLGKDVTLKQRTGSALNGIRIEAIASTTHALVAKAGSEGTVAIAPSVIVLTEGIGTQAKIESISDGSQALSEEERELRQLKVAGDIIVNSSTTAARTAEGNASTSGSNGSAGASVVVTVYNDSAESYNKRNSSSKNIKVTSASQTLTYNRAKAGAKGMTRGSKTASSSSASDEGGADQTADHIANLAANLAGSLGQGSMNASVISGLLSGRQKAQTAEGNVGFAAAIIVNVDKNKSIAEIPDGLDIFATGSFEVASKAKTDAMLNADGSAVKSKIGIGAAVAINVVTYTNRAYVGESAVIANSLTVSADLGSMAYGKLNKGRSNNLNDYIKDTLREVFDGLLAEAGITGQRRNAINDQVNTAITTATYTITAMMREGHIFSTYIDPELKALLLKRLAEADTRISEQMMEYAIQYAGNLVTGYLKKNFNDAIVLTQNDNSIYLSDDLEAEARGAAAEFFDTINDPTKFADFLVTAGGESLITLLQTICATADKDLSNKQVDALKSALSMPTQLGKNRSAFNYISTEAISGAGNTEVGIAGSVAIAIVNGTTSAKIAAFNKEGESITAKGNLVVTAKDPIHINTVSSAAADIDGRADTNGSNAGSSDNGSGKTTDETKVWKLQKVSPGEGDTGGTYTITDVNGNEIDSVTQGQDIYIHLNPEVGYTLNKAMVGSTELTNFLKLGGKTLVYVTKVGKVDDVLLVDVTFRKLNPNEAELMDDDSITENGSKVGVGASFALTVANLSTTAEIGKRDISAAAVEIGAESPSNTRTIAVAGTQAGGRSDKSIGSNIALDAAVAISVFNNAVHAGTNGQVNITTSGTNKIKKNTYNCQKPNGATEQVGEAYNFYIYAKETGTNAVKASGFAVGKKVAVGGSVAVSIGDSEAYATYEGNASLKNAVADAKILAVSSHEDYVLANATAMGADMDRFFKKFGTSDEESNKILEGILSGDYSRLNQAAEKNVQTTIKNGTANRIVQFFNKKKTQTGQTGNTGLPASSNIMRVLDTRTEGASAEAIQQGIQEAVENAGVTNSVNNIKSQSYQLAAAVGVNVMNHRAKTIAKGSITAGMIDIAATNGNNFSTKALGAAMTRASGSNSIAAGVAVSVNKANAIVEVQGDFASITVVPVDTTAYQAMDGITIIAAMDRNSSRRFVNLMANEATAGSVTGANGKAVLSGAVAILKSEAKTGIYIANGSHFSAKSLCGVGIDAHDATKVYLRAGAVSITRGSAVGLGGSFALAYDDDVLEVILGTRASRNESEGDSAADVATYNANDISIIGNDVSISATRKDISTSTYHSSLGLGFFVTIGERSPEKQGIINIFHDPVSKKYSVNFNFSLDKVMDALNKLLVQSYDNYHLEAISGSVGEGYTGTASVAGSAALLFYRNTTQVILGNGFYLNAKENVDVTARDKNSVKLVSGAYNQSPAKMGAAFNLSSIDDHSTTAVRIGDNVIIISGSYSQSASNENDVVVLSIAASEVSSGSSEYNIGGVVNVVNMHNKVFNTIGKSTEISASKLDLKINSVNDNYVVIAASERAESGQKIAAGGTVNILIAGSETTTSMGDHSRLISKGALEFTGNTDYQGIDLMSSTSPAADAAGVAAVIGVVVSQTTTTTSIGESSTLTSGSDMTIQGGSVTRLINIEDGLSIADKTAVGGAVSVNILKNKVNVLVGNGSALTSQNGSVIIEAPVKNWNLMVSVSLGVGGKVAAIAGVTCVVINKDTVLVKVGDDVVIFAGDCIGVMAGLDNENYIVAGGIAIESGKQNKIGVGATIGTILDANSASAIVGERANLTACVNNASGGGIRIPNRDERRSGITVYAGGNSVLANIAIGAAAGLGSVSASGVISNVIEQGDFLAETKSTASLTSRESTTPKAAGDDESALDSDDSEEDSNANNGNIYVAAVHKLTLIHINDDTAISLGASAGGTIAVTVSNESVSAFLRGKNDASGAVEVRADQTENLIIFAMSINGGKTGGGGVVNVLVHNATVIAGLEGSLKNASKLDVAAKNEMKLYDICVGVSGGLNAGTGVAMVTVFNGTVKAYIGAGSKIENVAGTVNVTADSYEYMTVDSAGGAGSATTAVAGDVNVIVAKQDVQAYVGENATVKAKGDVVIRASNILELSAVAEYLAVSGATSVGVAALVLVENNTLYAGVGDNAVLSGNDILIMALNQKDVLSTTGTIAASAGNAVSINVTVVVAGGRMNQAAHDAVFASNFDPKVNLNTALGSSKYLKGLNVGVDLSDLLEGDGQTDIYTRDYSKFGQKDGESELPGAQGGNGKDGVDDYDRVDVDVDNRFDTDISATPVSFSGSVKSVILASIGRNAKVTGKNITVEAENRTSVLAVNGGIAASAAGSAGVGLGVVVLHSNVEAFIGAGTDLKATGNVLVQAISGVSDKDLKSSKNVYEVTSGHIDRQATIDKALADADDIKAEADKNRIFLIGYSAGGSATVTVQINGGIFLNYDNTKALIAGNITAGGNLSVLSNYDYRTPLIISCSGAVGGLGAPTASVAVVYYKGIVENAISGNAQITVTGTTNVQVLGTARIRTAAAAVAGSAFGPSAGVSVGINKLTVWNYIGQGVSGVSGNIAMSHVFDTGSWNIIIDGSIGTLAVGVAVTVCKVTPKIYSFIGYDAEYAPADALGGAQNIEVKGDASVTGKVTGDITLRAIAFAGGLWAGNAVVALAFNDSTSICAITDKNIQIAKDLTIQSILNGKIIIKTYEITAQAFGGGAVVAVGKLTAVNRAILNIANRNVSVGESLTINAGTSENPSTAEVDVYMNAISAGAAGAGFSFAVALNNAENSAKITGTNTQGALKVSGSLTVYAKSNTTAGSYVITGGFKGKNANVSLAFGKLESRQYAVIDTQAKIEVGETLDVSSIQNDRVLDTPWVLQTYANEKGGSTAELKGTKAAVAEAVLFNANAALAGATVGVVIAKSNATSIASIKAGNLSVAKGTTVNNGAVASANAYATDYTYAGISLGVVVTHAYSDGTFIAEVESTGEISSPGGISVNNIYSSKAVSQAKPCGGYVTVSLASIKVNVVYAEVKTTAKASLGSGQGKKIYAGDSDIIVKNTGVTKAYSEIPSRIVDVSGGTLAVDVAIAKLNGTQDALISGGDITGKNIHVVNYHNVKSGTTETVTNPEPAADSGVTAFVGAPTVSVIMGTERANVAVAKDTAKITASVNAKSIDASGNILVHTGSTSIVKADQKEPVASVSGASLGVYVVNAQGGQIVNTSVNVANGNKVDAGGSISVTTASRTAVDATVLPVGGKGKTVNVSGFSVEVNEALATVNAEYKSSFTGAGTVSCAGMTIASQGTTDANAKLGQIENTNITINALNVKAAISKAYLNVTLDATGSFVGNVTVKGDLTILSKATNVVNANSGEQKGLTLGLATGSGVQAVADSKAKVTANLLGKGEKQIALNVMGDVVIAAENTGFTGAEVSNPMTAALMTVQAYLADAFANDTVLVNLSGIEAHFGHNVDIHTDNRVTAWAVSIAGNVISLVGGDGGTCRAKVGKDGGENSIVTIGDSSHLIATGDFTIKAYNSADVVSQMNKANWTVGVIGLHVNNVVTEGALNTAVNIGGNSVISSEYGSVAITANDYIKEDAKVNGSSVGILVNASNKRAENFAWQNTGILVEGNSTIAAQRKVLLSAWSDANMYAEALVNSGGFCAGGSAYAKNHLVRKVYVTLLDQAKLTCRAGEVSILTNAGENDKIKAYAVISEGGFICKIDNLFATNICDSYSDITIGKGIEIDAPEGNVTIKALLSLTNILSESIAKGEGGVSLAKTHAYFNNITGGGVYLRASVNIDGDSNLPAKISGKNVYVIADLEQFDVVTHADATARGVGANAQSYAVVRLALDILVNIGTAQIVASDSVDIHSDGDVKNGRVRCDAYTEVGSVGASVTAWALFTKADGSQGVTIKTTLGPNSTVTAKSINIDAVKLSIPNRFVKAHYFLIAIPGKHMETHDDFTNVAPIVYVGDGATFVIKVDHSPTLDIEITENEKGTAIARVLSSGYKVNYSYSGGYSIQLDSYSNVDSGTLRIANNINENGLTKCRVYFDGSPEIINVKSSLKYSAQSVLVMGFEHKFSGVVVLVNCKNSNYTILDAQDLRGQSYSFTMSDEAELVFSDFVHPTADLTVAWVDDGGRLEMRGSSSCAYLLVHSLTVRGAREIVGTESAPIYLCETSGVKTTPYLDVEADGRISLAVSYAYVENADGHEGSADNQGNGNRAISIKKVASKNDAVNLVILEAKTMRRLGGQFSCSVLSNGSVKLTNEWIAGDPDLSGITVDSLSSCIRADLSADGATAYQLPNGMLLYLGLDGSLQKLVSNSGDIFDTSNISVVEGKIYLAEQSLCIDPVAGYYYLAEDGQYLFQALDLLYAEGVYLSRNLDGTIIGKDCGYVYDAEFKPVDLSDEEAYVADGVDASFKWVTASGQGEEGYVIGCLSDGSFIGVYRAKNNGSGKITLIGAVDPQELRIAKEQLNRISGTEDSEDLTVWAYTDSLGEHQWYVLSDTRYYYRDKRSDQNLAVVSSSEDRQYVVKTVYVPGFGNVEIVGLLLGTKAYVLVGDTDGKHEVAYISFREDAKTDGCYIINDEWQFSTDGTVTRTITRQEASVSVSYNPSTRDFSAEERFTDDGESLTTAVQGIMTDGEYVLTLKGARHYQFANDKVAFDLGGNYYYRNSDGIWTKANSSKEGDLCYIVDASGKALYAYDSAGGRFDVGYSSEGKLDTMSEISAENELLRYRRENGSWVLDSGILIDENAPTGALNVSMTGISGKSVAITLKNRETLITGCTNEGDIISDTNVEITGDSRYGYHTMTLGTGTDVLTIFHSKGNQVSITSNSDGDLKGSIIFKNKSSSPKVQGRVVIRSQGSIGTREQMFDVNTYGEIVDLSSKRDIFVTGINVPLGRVDAPGNVYINAVGLTIDTITGDVVEIHTKSFCLGSLRTSTPENPSIVANRLVLDNNGKMLPGYNIYVKAKEFMKLGSGDRYSYIINVYRDSSEESSDDPIDGSKEDLDKDGSMDAKLLEAAAGEFLGLPRTFDNSLLLGLLWLVVLVTAGGGCVHSLRKR